jgi:4-hydroxy-tetrahydrodipicolinate synthase
MKLHGVVVPLATPLDDEGNPDRAAQQRLIDYLIGAGVNAIFVNGSMGGFGFWTARRQAEIAAWALEAVAGRVPVVAGISDSGTERVLEMIRLLEKLPLDGVVAMPPFYYLHDQRELLYFFETIAGASPWPLILYDNPRLCKNAIDVETVVTLSRHAKIAGIKVSRPDTAYWEQLLNSNIDPDSFFMLCGAGRMTDVGLDMGFDGVTEGLHNIVPELATALWRAPKGQRQAIQQEINRRFRIFEIDGGWRGIEVAFQYMGIAHRAAPHPCNLPLDPSRREAILEVLKTERLARPYIPISA